MVGQARLIPLDYKYRDDAVTGEILIKDGLHLYVKNLDGTLTEIQNEGFIRFFKYIMNNSKLYNNTVVDGDYVPVIDVNADYEGETLTVFDETTEINDIKEEDSQTFRRKTMNMVVYDETLDKPVIWMPNVFIKDVWRYGEDGNRVTLEEILDSIVLQALNAANLNVSIEQFNDTIQHFLIKGADFDISRYPTIKSIIDHINEKADATALDTYIEYNDGRLDTINSEFTTTLNLMDSNLSNRLDILYNTMLSTGGYVGSAQTLDDRITSEIALCLKQGGYTGDADTLDNEIKAVDQKIEDYNTAKMDKAGYIGNAQTLYDDLNTKITTNATNIVAKEILLSDNINSNKGEIDDIKVEVEAMKIGGADYKLDADGYTGTAKDLHDLITAMQAQIDTLEAIVNGG